MVRNESESFVNYLRRVQKFEAHVYSRIDTNKAYAKCIDLMTGLITETEKELKLMKEEGNWDEHNELFLEDMIDTQRILDSYVLDGVRALQREIIEEFKGMFKFNIVQMIGEFEHVERMKIKSTTPYSET